MGIFFGLIIRAGLACIPASIANKKGYSYAGFWCLGFFLSFLIGLIVALCLSDRNEYVPQYQVDARYAYPQPAFGKRCRNCGTYIHENDTFCSKCGASQAEPDAGSRIPAGADVSGQDEKSYSIRYLPVSALGNIACPGCGATQRADRNVCYKCGAIFTR